MSSYTWSDFRRAFNRGMARLAKPGGPAMLIIPVPHPKGGHRQSPTMKALLDAFSQPQGTITFLATSPQLRA